MKQRIILDDKEYIPQVKIHWWNHWRDVYNGHIYRIDEAIGELKYYEKKLKESPKVVWTNFSEI